MLDETPEAKKAELIRFRLEELKYQLEEVGHSTNNKLMKDIRNQLAHCSISYAKDGTVFMEEPSLMRQIPPEFRFQREQKTCKDGQGYEKTYISVKGKMKILYHIYTLEQWEQLYKRLRTELSEAGELIPLPRTVLGCPQCGDFPESASGYGKIACPHARDGTEKIYMRDEFGEIISNLTFNRSPNDME